MKKDKNITQGNRENYALVDTAEMLNGRYKNFRENVYSA